MKFKKNDTIIITAGKDKGKQGKIEQFFPQSRSVLVAGLNIYKKAVKKKDEKSKGGIIDFPRPIPSGNFAIICPKCKKPSRIGYDIKGEEKIRICKKCNKPI